MYMYSKTSHSGHLIITDTSLLPAFYFSPKVFTISFCIWLVWAKKAHFNVQKEQGTTLYVDNNKCIWYTYIRVCARNEYNFLYSNL